MAEYNFVLKNQEIGYEGLFTVGDLYKVINKFFKDKTYDWREVRHHEYVGDASKFVEIEMRPNKIISDYAKKEIRIYLMISDMKDVIIEQDGKKINMQKGKIDISIDAVLITDYEGKWESTPFYYFMRTVFDKFIYKRYIDRFDEILKNDTHELISTIKSYLNLYKYKFNKS